MKKFACFWVIGKIEWPLRVHPSISRFIGFQGNQKYLINSSRPTIDRNSRFDVKRTGTRYIAFPIFNRQAVLRFIRLVDRSRITKAVFIFVFAIKHASFALKFRRYFSSHNIAIPKIINYTSPLKNYIFYFHKTSSIYQIFARYSYLSLYLWIIFVLNYAVLKFTV